MTDHMSYTSSEHICYIYINAEASLDVKTRNPTVKALYHWMREKKAYPGMAIVAIVCDHTESVFNPM
jgi:hypothetical protein